MAPPNSSSPQQPEENDTANMMVALRIRPLTEDEKSKGASAVAYRIDEKMVVLMDPGENLDDVLRQNRSREKMFMFDHAFGPDSSQVYEATTQHLIDHVINGYNATVFAYGATGAGKTFTMLGTDERNPGIMSRALDDLFAKMTAEGDLKIFDTTISYLEIYNEVIRDLLNPSSAVLELREDQKGNIQVVGLSSAPASSSKEILHLLMQGNKRRTQEPTAANKTSSRSHAVLQVTIVQKDIARDINEQHQIGKLFMIDLAGSERAANTQNTGQRLKEGAHINRSLLALGNVINTLTEKGAKFVNYRDSKLTRLLRDSLGGNSKTIMIANISPASNQFEESRNTLIYADRAKRIRTKISKNTSNVTHHVTQYQSIISELRKEISRLQLKIEGHQTTRPETAMSSIVLGANPRNYSTSQLTKLPPLSIARKGSIGTSSHSNSASSISALPDQSSHKEFMQLKDELIAHFNEQMQIRHQLLEANDAAYQASIELAKRKAIIAEWDQEQQNAEDVDQVNSGIQNPAPADEDSGLSQDDTSNHASDNEAVADENDTSKTTPDYVIAARAESVQLEAEIRKCLDRKSELEWELSLSRRASEKIEETLPRKITNEDLNCILFLLARLHEAEMDKVLLVSDSTLNERRFAEQTTAIRSFDQLANVADQLIHEQYTAAAAENKLVEPKLDNLFNNYQTAKKQVHFELAPFDESSGAILPMSWNRELVEKERRTKESSPFSRTMTIAELRKMKNEQRFSSGSADHPTRRGSDDSLSKTSRSQMVLSNTFSKDDSIISYKMLPEPESTTKNAVLIGQTSTGKENQLHPLSLHDALRIPSRHPAGPCGLRFTRALTNRKKNGLLPVLANNNIKSNIIDRESLPSRGRKQHLSRPSSKSVVRNHQKNAAGVRMARTPSPNVAVGRNETRKKSKLPKVVRRASLSPIRRYDRSKALRQPLNLHQLKQPVHIADGHRGKSHVPASTAAVKQFNPNRRVRSPTVAKLPFIFHEDSKNANFISRKVSQ